MEPSRMLEDLGEHGPAMMRALSAMLEDPGPFTEKGCSAAVTMAFERGAQGDRSRQVLSTITAGMVARGEPVSSKSRVLIAELVAAGLMEPIEGLGEAP